MRAARLGREVGLSEWVKLEVIGDERTLFPDTEELVSATKTLVKEGFIVLPYTTDDLIVARKLIDAGASAVMPLGAPIGSGLGIQNLANLRILRERVTEVPLIVDAGVGTASDAAIAMELGADGVLMNTAIAGAQDTVLMAEAMRAAVEAGRKAFLAGRITKKLYATASSPLAGVVKDPCRFAVVAAPPAAGSWLRVPKQDVPGNIHETVDQQSRETANLSSSTHAHKIIPRLWRAIRISNSDMARGLYATARKLRTRRIAQPTRS